MRNVAIIVGFGHQLGFGVCAWVEEKKIYCSSSMKSIAGRLRI